MRNKLGVLAATATAGLAVPVIGAWWQLGPVVWSGPGAVRFGALVFALALAPGLILSGVALDRRPADFPGPDTLATRPGSDLPRLLGSVLVLAGTCLIVLGAVPLADDGTGALRRVLGFGWRFFARALGVHVPYLLLGAGLAYVLAGLGLWQSRDRWLRRGVLLAATVSIGSAGSVGAANVMQVRIGFRYVNRAGLTLAAGLALAGLLLVGWALSGQLRLAPRATADDATGATDTTGATDATGADGTAVPAGRGRGGSRRRWTAVAGIVAAVAGALTWRVWSSGDRIDELFPDHVLAGCVASALGTDPGDTAGEAELASILTLGCHGLRDGGSPVRDITGLERLPSLVALNLADNQIRDLRPLAGLPRPQRLFTVKLTNNQVVDLSPLAGLTHVQDLGLSGNGVSDLRPLRGLTRVRELGVARNQVVDLAPLAGMTQLTWLDLSDNRIRDVGVLAGFTLTERITLTRNRIADLTPLGGLPHLSRLDLAFNQVRDVAALGRSTTLEELWLGGNPVHDLTPLVRIRSLTGVDVHECDPATLIGIDRLRARGVYVGGTA